LPAKQTWQPLSAAIALALVAATVALNQATQRQGEVDEGKTP
jgi:hypothetical protein